MEAIELAADPPFGVMPDHPYRVRPLPLEPGDRVYFLTDGMLERPADVNLRELIRTSADEHPREAVQPLMAAVLDALGGELKDDATVMCLDWHGGGPERDRHSAGGANR